MATHGIGGPDKRAYLTDGHVMVEVEPTYPAPEPASPTVESIFDETLWKHKPAVPVGYQFRCRHNGNAGPSDNDGRNQTAVIAFDRDGLVVAARYYEVILEAAGTAVTWTGMQARRGTKRYDSDRERWHVVRADTPERQGIAYVAPYLARAATPAIKALVDAGRAKRELDKKTRQ